LIIDLNISSHHSPRWLCTQTRKLGEVLIGNVEYTTMLQRQAGEVGIAIKAPWACGLSERKRTPAV
jgi:hypothetical protein